jgi:hypothetical protein
MFQQHMGIGLLIVYLQGNSDQPGKELPNIQ